MKTYCKDDPHEEMDYQKYKAGKFEDYKRRIKNLLIGVCQTSLKDTDKKMLVTGMKIIVKKFKNPY